MVFSFSTPENKSKVIELTINENYLGSAISNQGFEKLTGADADKFTLAGNKLTFIAKAFEAGSDNTYRVKIKATYITTTQAVFIDGKLNHLAFVFRRRKIRSRGNTKCLWLPCKCLE
jgi:hypothetical protein